MTGERDAIGGSNQLEEACETSDTFGTVSWIKHFFNISEEELK